MYILLKNSQSSHVLSAHQPAIGKRLSLNIDNELFNQFFHLCGLKFRNHETHGKSKEII